MEPLLRNLGQVCAAASELLIGCAWKGLVLVAAVAMLLRALPRLSAGVRSRVWVAVLLLLLLLPVFSLLLAERAASGGAQRDPGLLQGGAVWSFAIAGAWTLLSLIRLGQLAAGALRLHGIARRAVPAQGSEAIQRLIASETRAVLLCVSADVGRPSVAGFFWPRILLPVGLLEELSAAELEHVVLHELEHLRRRDDWTNLLQKLSLAVFPLHPALHWLDRRLCLERELACDDGVLRATGARKAYAACLARLAEDSMMRRGLSLALGLLGMREPGGERRSELRGRVLRILRSPATAMGRVQAGFATVALLGVTLGGSMLLARSPRLIGFAVPYSQPSVTTASARTLPAPVPQTIPLSPYRAVAAKAVIRQAAAAAVVSRRHRSSLRRVAFERLLEAGDAPSMRYTVLTTWQQETAMPHLTLTLATDAPASRSTQSSQPAYAAVPVRGGWLLIQL